MRWPWPTLAAQDGFIPGDVSDMGWRNRPVLPGITAGAGGAASVTFDLVLLGWLPTAITSVCCRRTTGAPGLAQFVGATDCRKRVCCCRSARLFVTNRWCCCPCGTSWLTWHRAAYRLKREPQPVTITVRAGCCATDPRECGLLPAASGRWHVANWSPAKGESSAAVVDLAHFVGTRPIGAGHRW